MDPISSGGSMEAMQGLQSLMQGLQEGKNSGSAKDAGGNANEGEGSAISFSPQQNASPVNF